MSRLEIVLSVFLTLSLIVNLGLVVYVRAAIASNTAAAEVFTAQSSQHPRTHGFIFNAVF